MPSKNGKHTPKKHEPFRSFKLFPFFTLLLQSSFTCFYLHVPDRPVVRISDSHSGDRGSNPRQGNFSFLNIFFLNPTIGLDSCPAKNFLPKRGKQFWVGLIKSQKSTSEAKIQNPFRYHPFQEITITVYLPQTKPCYLQFLQKIKHYFNTKINKQKNYSKRNFLFCQFRIRLATAFNSRLSSGDSALFLTFNFLGFSST